MKTKDNLETVDEVQEQDNLNADNFESRTYNETESTEEK